MIGNMIRSSTGMGKVLPVSREFPHSNNRVGDSSSVLGSAATQRLILKKFSSFAVCMILLLYAAATCLGQSSAETNFTVYRESYNCSTNIICLGYAHSYIGNDTNESGKIQVGRLSLLEDGIIEPNDVGVAYYHEPIKFLDLSTNTSFSFNTSFVIDKIKRNCTGYGDGLAFVISADNSTVGEAGGSFGMFHDPGGTTPFTSIIVEFDTFQNPPFDINNNHVSFDFRSVRYAAVANVTPLLQMGEEWTIYAWVEYSYETKKLEARVSNDIQRPISPALNYTVDLFYYLEEYMWVGFSSGSGICYNDYYIGDWTFESYSPISIGALGTSVKPSGTPLSIIIGVSVVLPTFLLASIVFFVFVLRTYCRRQLQWDTSMTKETTMQVGGMPERISFKQLSLATEAFSQDCKLGQGGFGSVYRGVLPSSGIPVAVKKINSDSTQGEKEFMAEVSIISRLRHRNLIELLGWCKDSSQGNYLLVYELMPNGSLDKALFGPTEKLTVILSWEQRFNIVTGIAAALDYLHLGWTQQIIHRDVKASNIMLDKDWNAKLGDFGLARLVDHQKEGATTAIVGTYGYIAPELPSTSRFTDKTDVFAFGAVVLEVACGRKALRTHLPEDEMLLVDWVWQSLSDDDLMRTVDERLKDYDRYWMELMLKVGLLCSHPDPLARPSMRHVVQILAGDVPAPSIPTSKPIFVYKSFRRSVPMAQLHVFSDSPAAARSTSSAMAELHDSPGIPAAESTLSSNSGSVNQIKRTV